jgi:hypothetical protein
MNGFRASDPFILEIRTIDTPNPMILASQPPQKLSLFSFNEPLLFPDFDREMTRIDLQLEAGCAWHPQLNPLSDILP